jgi:hypothetical protein
MAITYAMYIQTFLKVDEDSKGLYVEVPGYAGDWFKVRCEENDICPQVTHCRCSKFAHKGTCEHAQSVQFFWARIYKTNIAKAEMKALEQAMDEADAIEAAYEVAELTEQIAATEDQTTSTVKIAQPVATSKLAPRLQISKIDHHSKVTASFFSSLPSRQKSKVA